MLFRLSAWACVAGLLTAGEVAARAQLVTDTPDLPPLAGSYSSFGNPFQLYFVVSGPTTVALIGFHLSAFSATYLPPQNVGDTGAEPFTATATGELVVNAGTPTPFSATATADISLTKASGPNGSPAGTYSQQLTQMDISGLPGGDDVRVDPVTPSAGQTTILPDGGRFVIDSFFDVFTDISLDSGATWTAASTPNRLLIGPAAVPEPSSAAFAVAGLAGAALILRRRIRAQPE